MAIQFYFIGILIVLSSMYVFTQGQTLVSDTRGCTNLQQQVSQNEEAIRLLQTLILKNSNTIMLQEETLNMLMTADQLTVFETGSMYASLTTAFDGQGIIPFDKVYTNIGYRYRMTTGYFICPVDGLYIFSWSVEAKSSDISTTLRVNDQDVATLTAHPNTIYSSDSSTRTVAVKMKAGDKAGVYLTTGSAQPRSSFAGWKVKNNNTGTVLHAVLSRDAEEGTLLFDNILFNTDNCYSTRTGKYIAKEKGTYVFCLTIKAQENGSTLGRLVFDFAEHLEESLIDAQDPGTYDIGTVCMTAMMDVGDFVYADLYLNKALAMQTTLTGLRVDDESEEAPSFAVTTRKSFTGIIKFEYEVSNSGMYNAETGKAVMPTDGVYVFAWNIKSSNNTDVVSQIMVNGIPKGETFADSHLEEIDVSTGFAILKLSLNDTVYICVKSGISHGWASHFSGFRLHKF